MKNAIKKRRSFNFLKVLLASLFFICMGALSAQAETTLAYELINNTNGQFSDDEIYVAVIGQHNDFGAPGYCFLNLAAGSQGNSGKTKMSDSWNTMHKTSGDWGYAACFYKLSQIPGKKIHVPLGLYASRIFFSFKSPLYIHFFRHLL